MKNHARIITRIVLTTSAAALWLSTVPAFAGGIGGGPFQPGEILLTDYGANRVQRYSSAGVLEQTYTGAGIGWLGSAVTPGGNLVTSVSTPQGISIFNPAGTQIASFATTGTLEPVDVSVFANGTLALSDESGSDLAVNLYSQSGTSLGSVGLGDSPDGSTVGTDNILYVGIQHTNTVSKVSQAGAFLGDISLSFAPGDLVMSPTDGTLWVSGIDDEMIHHITTGGTVLGSFDTGLSGSFLGIGISPDGDTLYATATSSTVISEFDLSGDHLGDIALQSPNEPGFLTVVPNPVGAPEPASAALLLGGGALLALRRRRR